MSLVPGLASPHDALDGLVYFPRMLSKIRLHAAGKLPEEYVPYLGEGLAYGGHVFDARLCRLLGVPYAAVVAQVLDGADDGTVLEWARRTGANPPPERFEVWSGYAAKRGWRDDASPSMRKWAAKLGADPAAVLTWFDGMDVDEGRKSPGDFAPEPPFKPGPFPGGRATPIPGLPSPYEAVDGLLHFPRMAAKIALHAAGKLPEAWAVALGYGAGAPETARHFDACCCRFLGIDYAALQAKVLSGETDPAALLAWVFGTTGKVPTAEERTAWNAHMRKRGWRDAHHERLVFRLEEVGFPADAVETMFDFLDIDEGRPVLHPDVWVKKEG